MRPDAMDMATTPPAVLSSRPNAPDVRLVYAQQRKLR